MKKTTLLPIFSLTILFAFSTCVFSDSEPANLGLHKLEIERYYDSGLYFSDINARIRDAIYYLQFRINQNNRLTTPKKLAIVLDIDETALSNYNDLKHLQFGGTPEEIEAANADGHDTAIPGTLSLFHYAKKNHIAVFFITGRKKFEHKITVENLQNAGYRDWDGLFMEPDDYHKISTVSFKTICRKKIIEMGYDIALDVGDQYSDLKGGYADMVIKLPNPFYYLS